MIYPKDYVINGTSWDVDELFNGSQRNDKTAQRQFLGLLYRQYSSIRFIMGGKKCQKTHIDKLKLWLSDDENREKVRKTLRYSDEKIDFIMFMAENEIPFVR